MHICLLILLLALVLHSAQGLAEWSKFINRIDIKIVLKLPGKRFVTINSARRGDILVDRFNADGESEASTSFTFDNFDRVLDGLLDPEGNIVVFGYCWVPPVEVLIPVVTKLTPELRIVWRGIYTDLGTTHSILPILSFNPGNFTYIWAEMINITTMATMELDRNGTARYGKMALTSNILGRKEGTTVTR